MKTRILKYYTAIVTLFSDLKSFCADILAIALLIMSVQTEQPAFCNTLWCVILLSAEQQNYDEGGNAEAGGDSSANKLEKFLVEKYKVQLKWKSVYHSRRGHMKAAF